MELVLVGVSALPISAPVTRRTVQIVVAGAMLLIGVGLAVGLV